MDRVPLIILRDYSRLISRCQCGWNCTWSHMRCAPIRHTSCRTPGSFVSSIRTTAIGDEKLKHSTCSLCKPDLIYFRDAFGSDTPSRAFLTTIGWISPEVRLSLRVFPGVHVLVWVEYATQTSGVIFQRPLNANRESNHPLCKPLIFFERRTFRVRRPMD